MSYCGILPDAFARAELVDVRMDWPEGLAIGRLSFLWATTQARRMEVLGRKEAKKLLKTGGSEGDTLLEQLSHKDVHFLEPRDGDLFFVVGNTEQIRKIEEHRQKSIKGGKASAAIRAKGTTGEPEVQPGVEAQADQGSTSGSTTGQPTTTTTTTTTSGVEETPDGVSLSPPRRRPPSPSPKKLADLWNEVAHANMPRVQDLDPDQRRYKAAQARLRKHPDLEFWRQVIERMNGSPFCRGEVEPREGRSLFVAKFDWLVQPDTARKVLEGSYDDRAAVNGSGKTWVDYLTPEERARL
jgi:hypothetical protein